MWSTVGMLGTALAITLTFAVLRIVPRWLASGSRTRLLRVAPVLELLLLTSLVALAVRVVVGESVGLGGGIAVALFVLIVAGHRQVRNYLAGISIRAGGRLAIGDAIRVEDTRGVVVELGTLHAVLDTASGTVIIPWNRVSEGIVHRVRTDHNGVRHSFAMPWPKGIGLAEVQARVLRVVLLDGGAVGAQEPQVQPTSVGTIEVGVVALDLARAYELERSVRAAVTPNKTDDG